MTIVLGTLILAWMLYGCALMYLDVRDAAEHESTLDELWGEDE